MNNTFLNYLLDYNPEKAVSKSGVIVRKIISPLLRFVVPFVTPNSKLVIIRRAPIHSKPVIFAAIHGFREDVEHTVVMANRQAYMLNGSLTQVFRSVDGITAWLAGVILIDRMDKQSRSAAKEKLIRALKLGTSVIIYPEGTWNKSPNQLISGLFSGVYDIAKETGALVVPIATYRNKKIIYGIMEDAFDICAYERKEGLSVLRDKMATMQYELMEQYGQCKRTEFPYGKLANEYWNDFVDGLMKEVKYYDYDVECHTKYHDKDIVAPHEVFSFFENIKINKNNLFLLKPYIKFEKDKNI